MLFCPLYETSLTPLIDVGECQTLQYGFAYECVPSHPTLHPRHIKGFSAEYNHSLTIKRYLCWLGDRPPLIDAYLCFDTQA